MGTIKISLLAVVMILAMMGIARGILWFMEILTQACSLVELPESENAAQNIQPIRYEGWLKMYKKALQKSTELFNLE